MPAEAGPTLEDLFDVRRRLQSGRRQLERSADECRAVLVRQGHRLLRGQLVALRGRVVGDESARGLRVQPLADVALARPGLLGQLR